MAQNLNPNLPMIGLPPKPAAKRLIPLLLGGAGLVLLSGSGILVGLNSKLTALQTSAQQKDAEVSSSEQIAHRYQTTLDSYNETQGHIKFLETSVPDKSYVPTLLAQLQTLAAQTHLSVATIRPTASAPVAAAPARTPDGTPGTPVKKALPPPYDTLDVAVDVSGSYADTSTFLYSLTRFPKIVSVNSVQMHPGAPATPGGSAVITTNLKLTAFMFHDAAPADAPGSPTPGGPAPPPVTAAPVSVSVVPPTANGTVYGAVGRAAQGAAAATREDNTRNAEAVKTL